MQKNRFSPREKSTKKRYPSCRRRRSPLRSTAIQGGHQSTRRCRAAQGLGLQTSSTGAFGWWGAGKCLKGLVDLEGFEPSTSSMPWKRAPNCATGPRVSFNIARAGASDGAASQHEARNAGCSAPTGGKCRFGRPALQRVPPAHAGWFARGTSRRAPRTRRPAHELREPRLLRAPVHVFVATDPDCTPSIGNARCSAPAGCTCRGQQLSFATRRVRTQAGSRGGTSRPAPRTRRPAHQPRQCRLLRAPVHVFVATDPDCTSSIGNARCSAPAGGKCRFGRPALQRAPPAHARSVSR